MPRYDSPFWSWLHGCTIHKGQDAPCLRCLAEGHPAVIDLAAPPELVLEIKETKEEYEPFNWEDWLTR